MVKVFVMSKLNLKPENLAKLRQLLNQQGTYRFLGYLLDLETGEIQDQLAADGQVNETEVYVLGVLLNHYAEGKLIEPSGKQVKFKDLPGGTAYEQAFLQRAVQLVAETFDADPSALPKAATVIGGAALSHGDASAKVPALGQIALVYIVWAGGEFSGAASVLYDENAGAMLPTEDLAVLGELTTSRLKRALQKL